MLFDIMPDLECNQSVQKYIIPGKPVPLQRPRYAQARIFDSQKQEKCASRVYITNQHNDQPLLTGPLCLNIEFYFETPKKTKSLNGKYHTAKPDTDNCVKYICDIIQGILIADDSVIAQIVATKLYDTVPRTEFTLRKLL